MDLRETSIPGCLRIRPPRSRDGRGSFVKTFHAELFREHGLETGFVEEYYSLSHRGVVRGLHFQQPPQDHVKVVTCLHGEVLDAVVDLRRGSPRFREAEVFTLDAEEAEMLYIPKGLAHGFCVTSESAILLYRTSTLYAPDCDAGVRWDSAGIDWPVADPILSERDRSFVTLAEFSTPFEYAT